MIFGEALVPLKANESIELTDGDTFSLIPNHFPFQLRIGEPILYIEIVI